MCLYIKNQYLFKEFERESRRPTTPEFSNFREENKQSENEKDKFEYFWQKESVFSQWYPSKFVVDGVEYSCAEQYMMQQKAGMMLLCSNCHRKSSCTTVLVLKIKVF